MTYSPNNTEIVAQTEYAEDVSLRVGPDRELTVRTFSYELQFDLAETKLLAKWFIDHRYCKANDD